MGRTLPSATMVFDGEAARWARFRRALRAEDQQILDELFVQARRHIVALGNASSPAPMEGVLLAMLLETKREVRRLSLKLQRLDAGLGRDLADTGLAGLPAGSPSLSTSSKSG